MTTLKRQSRRRRSGGVSRHRSGALRGSQPLRRRRLCGFRSVIRARETVPWDEFSGRLEAVERVEIRPGRGRHSGIIFVKARWSNRRLLILIDRPFTRRTLRAPKARWPRPSSPRPDQE